MLRYWTVVDKDGGRRYFSNLICAIHSVIYNRGSTALDPDGRELDGSLAITLWNCWQRRIAFEKLGAKRFEMATDECEGIYRSALRARELDSLGGVGG